MFYPKHTPDIVKPLAKDLVFDLPNARNEIYLTFDDGPRPEITPWVLGQLDAVGAKATFFLLGKHAEEYPDLVGEIKARGHAIGNHSHTHLSGWRTKNSVYFADVNRCQTLTQSSLFRPPYGQITFSQAKGLRTQFRIIHWSDLSGDFDPALSADDCLKYATAKVKAGSIIVFHDSEKAWPRLEQALPKALAYYREKGFEMAAIPT